MNSDKYTFNHMFSTDGVGCSLLFSRVDLKDTPIPQSKNKNTGNKEYDYITELDNTELNHL